MKTSIKIILAAILCCGLFTAKADTNNTAGPIQPNLMDTNASFSDGWKMMKNAIATSTNLVAAVGGGHSIKGQNWVAFAVIGYNFNDHVGAVIGYDYLWNSHANEANLVRGGVTLSDTIHPFAFISPTFLPNFVVRPFVGDLLATPKGNNAVGNIVVSGLDFEVATIKNWKLHIEAEYNNRSGQGEWDGNYGTGSLALTKGF